MSGALKIPQTATQLRALLASRGLTPNRRFGQNFLIEPPVLDVILRLADLKAEDVVLEVGTGVGTLTHRLAEAPHVVVTVEIDSGLYALARDLLGNVANVRLIHGDVMATKSTLNAEVCEKLDVAFVAPGVDHFKVVANLPYNVSTPFLSSLLVRYGAPDRMVLMVQRELAENLVAEPGQKSYSPLTIMMQLLASVKIDRVLPRDVFWPKPRVDSAIVVVEGNGVESLPVMRAFPFIRFLFGERRKTLAAVLKKLPAVRGGPLSAETVDDVLASMDLTGSERAETLTPDQFLQLDRAVSTAGDR